MLLLNRALKNLIYRFCGYLQKNLIKRILAGNSQVISIYECNGRGFNQSISEYNKLTLIILLRDETTSYQLREIYSVVMCLFGKFIFHDQDNIIFRISDLKQKIQLSDFYRYRITLSSHEWKLLIGEAITQLLNVEDSLQKNVSYFTGELKYWFAYYCAKRLSDFSRVYSQYELNGKDESDDENHFKINFFKKIHNVSRDLVVPSVEVGLTLRFNEAVYERNQEMIKELRSTLETEWGAYFKAVYLAQCLEYDIETPCLIVEIEDIILSKSSCEKLKKSVAKHVDSRIFVKHLDTYFQVTTDYCYEYYQAFFREDEFPELIAQKNFSKEIVQYSTPRLFFEKLKRTVIEIDHFLLSRELLKIEDEHFYSFIWKFIQITYLLSSVPKGQIVVSFDKEELISFLEQAPLEPLSLQVFKQERSQRVSFLERKILVEQLAPIYNLAKENLSSYEVGSGKYKSDLNNRSLKK